LSIARWQEHKPVRGRGAAKPRRKVFKWGPSLGGLVCCPPVLGGGSVLRRAPQLAFTQCLYLCQLAVGI